MSEEYVNFKEKFNLQQRQSESKRILEKYPNRIPVIIEKSHQCKKIGLVDKNKYLIPKDLTLGQLMYVIRKRLSITSEQGIFLFINNTMIPVTQTMDLIYKNNHDEDNFLYIVYAGENTFG